MLVQKNETKERPKRDAEAEIKQDSRPPADAVIQLAGGALQSLFGVAYVQDVAAVVRRIDEIDGNLMSNIKSVKNDQDHLSQETKDTLIKQDRTIHMVEKMAKTVDKKVGKTFLYFLHFLQKVCVGQFTI